MWWNNVETKPYGGYPPFYDVNYPAHRAGEPGGAGVERSGPGQAPCPLRVFEGMTIFDAGAGRPGGDRLTPTDKSGGS